MEKKRSVKRSSPPLRAIVRLTTVMDWTLSRYSRERLEAAGIDMGSWADQNPRMREALAALPEDIRQANIGSLLIANYYSLGLNAPMVQTEEAEPTDSPSGGQAAETIPAAVIADMHVEDIALASLPEQLDATAVDLLTQVEAEAAAFNPAPPADAGPTRFELA